MSDQNPQSQASGANPAADIVRSKIKELYKKEPNAREELLDAEEAGRHRTKHQKFMYELSTSGKSLAEIQTAWHNYYVALSDEEKHAVWQEFYAEHGQAPHFSTQPSKPQAHHAPQDNKATRHPAEYHASTPRSSAEIKNHIVHKALKRAKLPKNHHVRSLLFGLTMGSFVILALLFSFFNERFIAPFITPSRAVSSTQIIIDPNNTGGSKEPEIIIPKINVEVPVVYNAASRNENDIQKALEDGVVHYPTKPKPGELGNVPIVGHSSNNIFNQGKYKFAFVLLKRLDKGDKFYINYQGTRYVYQIYEKKIVTPSDVSVLSKQSRPATATLITCDPPGTSLNRLVIIGEQITPSPNKNKKSKANVSDEQTSIVPGNAPSLWRRLKNWLFN